jgi:predicted ABC-type ATPase
LKEYILFAGVNGAGKSTLYNLPDIQNLKRINTDEILVADGGNWDNPKDALSAMRKGINLINTYLKEGTSFCQETTLTGKMILKLLVKAKESGYKIKMYYIGLESSDIAVERVKNRVKIGGHGIPEEDILRRYKVSMQNFKNVVKICDDVFVFDNSIIFRPIATFENGKLINRNDLGVKWFKKIFPE